MFQIGCKSRCTIFASRVSLYMFADIYCFQSTCVIQESNTREKYNTTATLTVSIKDGDDQYPQFLPCTPVSQDENISVCTNPVYTTNITEKDQVTLSFPYHSTKVVKHCLNQGAKGVRRGVGA